jgi:pilus assembly protein Flp/PilA
MLERLAIWATKSVARFEELRSEKGQALVEYGLILALVAVACLIALQTLGTDVADILGQVSTAIENA